MRERRQGLYTQRQLARRVGVTQATISKWESGDLAMPDAMKVRVAAVFDASLDELFPWPLDVCRAA